MDFKWYYNRWTSWDIVYNEYLRNICIFNFIHQTMGYYNNIDITKISTPQIFLNRRKSLFAPKKLGWQASSECPSSNLWGQRVKAIEKKNISYSNMAMEKNLYEGFTGKTTYDFLWDFPRKISIAMFDFWRVHGIHCRKAPCRHVCASKAHRHSSTWFDHAGLVWVSLVSCSTRIRTSVKRSHCKAWCQAWPKKPQKLQAALCLP